MNALSIICRTHPVSLMYHDIVERGWSHESGFRGRHADRYKLSSRQLEEHLMAIREGGGGCALSGRRAESSSQPVLLTFDDGGVSAAITADILERHGWRGLFFVPTGYLGRSGFCTISQVVDLHRRGHLVGSHSHSHPTRMSAMSDRELHEEWSTSRAVLSAMLGEPVTSASLPGGYYSIRVARAAAASGYSLLFTSEPTRRVTDVDGCAILGRYPVLGTTSPRRVGDLVAGSWWPRVTAAVSWNARKAVKRTGGSVYLKVQRRLLG